MSYRTNRLGQQVSDSHETANNNEYTIDVDYDYFGMTSVDNDLERVGSAKYEDVGNEEEATTPILRPWTKTNFRKVATSDVVDVHKVYDPTHYTSGSDFSHSQSSVDNSPLSLSSEDNGDESHHIQSAEPLTPSRLLTLHSFDFMDVDVDGVGIGISQTSSISQGHSSDSPGHNRDNGSISNDNHPNTHVNKNNPQPSPTMSPITIAPKDINITDDDLKNELTIHGDIVSEYATQLTLSLKDHMSEVMLKLAGQKETEIRGRDAFYTKELQKQQIIIEDLETVVTTYEHNILNEEENVEKYKALVSSVCLQLREQYFSPFSMMRLLQHWRMFTGERRRMARLHRMATKHHIQSVQRAVFVEFKRESCEIRAERRGVDEKTHFDKTVRDLVSRYEKQILTLTSDLQESQASLAQEKARRQQLEEDLRRMFLKNMTVMNMEALSLFQTPVVAPPQLAEFGPEKKHACERQKVAATQERQEGMISHMRKQQQQLQSHQHEYNNTGSERANVGSAHPQSKVKRTAHMSQQPKRHITKSYAVSTSSTERSNNRQNKSSNRQNSYSAEWDDEEGEEEEEFPRMSPHPLPYHSASASASAGGSNTSDTGGGGGGRGRAGYR